MLFWIDVVNGFWARKVDLTDQYKLAFYFSNRQFTVPETGTPLVILIHLKNLTYFCTR